MRWRRNMPVCHWFPRPSVLVCPRACRSFPKPLSPPSCFFSNEKGVAETLAALRCFLLVLLLPRERSKKGFQSHYLQSRLSACRHARARPSFDDASFKYIDYKVFWVFFKKMQHFASIFNVKLQVAKSKCTEVERLYFEI